MTTKLNPTKRRQGCECGGPLLAFALAVGAMACSDAAPITGPDAVSLPPSSPPPVSWVVQGTVFEHTMSGMRPLAGVPLRVFKSGVNSGIVDVISSADGTYDGGVGASFVRVQLGPSSSHSAPCPPFAWSEQPLNVHVVPRAVLSTTGMPPSYPTKPTQHFHAVISGRVLEQTSGGLEPVSAATVTLSGGGAPPAADTLTDANGRYLLCSVGNSEAAVTVQAHKEGYTAASATEAPWFGWNLDLELTRR